MNDEELRREYQRSSKAAPPGAHPDPEQLESIVNGDGSEAERLLMLEHVLQCPTCGPELTLLRGREISFTADRPFAAYADGDPIADLPVTIRVVPRALKVLVP